MPKNLISMKEKEIDLSDVPASLIDLLFIELSY
jgi:hypothetical protein